jgi:hypothetical protein
MRRARNLRGEHAKRLSSGADAGLTDPEFRWQDRRVLIGKKQVNNPIVIKCSLPGDPVGGRMERHIECCNAIRPM